MADSADDPDRALVLRVADGDAAAYRTLVRRYIVPITSFAYRMLGNRADAEEVGQETFARVWSYAIGWRPEARAKSWIYRIASNLCLDRLRARRPTVDIADWDMATDDDTPEQSLARVEAHDGLHRALARLPERQRTAIALFHLDGMAAAEVAEAMEISIDALESLLRRGRRNLKDMLSSSGSTTRPQAAAEV